MKHRILSLLLAALLSVGAFACAGPAEAASDINLYDTSLSVGGKTYVFPMPVAELAAMGVNVPDVSGLSEGQYYYDVPVDDGRNAFSVRVDYVAAAEDHLWATGVHLDSGKHGGQSVGGLVLGETTMKEVLEACGPDSNGQSGDSDYLSYSLFGNNYSWNLSFESADEGAKLTRLIMSNGLPLKYGDVDASAADASQENLPDPSGMAFDSYILGGKLYQRGATVQDLLDGGWALPADHPADASVAAGLGNSVRGERMYLYNGADLVYVGAFNYSGEECALAECTIEQIEASALENGALICADGIQAGVTTFAEASAILGAPASDGADADGARIVAFEVLDGVTYELTVDAQELVTAISIRGLNG